VVGEPLEEGLRAGDAITGEGEDGVLLGVRGDDVSIVALSFRALPTMSGTATTPAYMLRTCWRPYSSICGSGSLSSTGWVSFFEGCDVVVMGTSGIGPPQMGSNFPSSESG